MKPRANLADYKSTVVFYGENPITEKTSTWDAWCFASSQVVTAANMSNGKDKKLIVSHLLPVFKKNL